VKVAAISVAGLALFLWPFAASGTPPAATAAALSIGIVAILVFIEASTRRLDARRFALLAAIAAIDAALRLVLVTGLGGFSPIFFLILAAGYVYGPSYGFLTGSVTLLVSAVATGGIGPWLPYEMIGCGFVGLVAGIAGLHRAGPVTWRDVALLAAVGVVTGFVYGALLDVWDWTAFYRGTPGFGWQPGLSLPDALGRFGRFYLTTSLVYDAFRAAGNLIAVIVLGAPVLAGLIRMRSRFSVTVVRAGPQPALAGPGPEAVSPT
jgi:energy-coupling factor transport system substrate-specific component